MSSSRGDRSRSDERALASQVATPSQLPGVGKRTLIEQLAPAAPSVPHASAVQMRANAELGAYASLDDAAVHAAASRGMVTPASALPHGAALQQLFGWHDTSGIKAHTGSEAAASLIKDAARLRAKVKS